MSATSTAEATALLGRRDPRLRQVLLYDSREDVRPVIDSLQLHPSFVTFVDLSCNNLDDVAGIGLAKFVETSTTIRVLYAYKNKFGDATYLAMAKALWFNSSLLQLGLFGKGEVNENVCDSHFAHALQVNIVHPVDSRWYLYKMANEFPRLKLQAIEGHPSLVSVLLRKLA